MSRSGRVQITLEELRRHAIGRSLFAPTTLARAIAKLGFVQADPIRAPARAQDLTLRHRVRGYRAGDLERRYPRLALEEDYFVNYGYLPRAHHALMHPRTPLRAWSEARAREAAEVLEFVRAHGAVHPRLVAAHFARGRVRNWFGGTTHATTVLLDEMHYRGLLRVARRDGGTRVYAVRAGATDPLHLTPAQRLEALMDLIMRKYAPLPASSLTQLSAYLRSGAPQWREERAAALAQAKTRLPSTRIDGVTWYWPDGESPRSSRWALDDEVRLLAPFDPVVWDRRRFTMLFGWTYRFEAYTPAAKRTRGYYALPLLWRGHAIGWGNLAVRAGQLDASFGYVKGRAPRERAFGRALGEELARVEAFLGL